jgi:hypothetical protein
MKSSCFVLDIETAPLSLCELKDIIPPFDPEAVKTGNIKDADKIAEKIRQAESDYIMDTLERAALGAHTGQVLVIGLKDAFTGETEIVGQEDPASATVDDEAAVIRWLWNRLDAIAITSTVPPILVGFNTHKFDLPFLVRRSWKLGLHVPPWLRRGRYWGEQCYDLMEAWQLGDWKELISLDSLCKHLGLGGKNGSGKEFAALWRSDNARARAYLERDLYLTQQAAIRLGVIQEWMVKK